MSYCEKCDEEVMERAYVEVGVPVRWVCPNCSKEVRFDVKKEEVKVEEKKEKQEEL